MAFTWQVDPTIAYPDLFDNYARVIFQSGNRVAHQRAADATQWMKVNAPWVDRTGDARRGLHVKVKESPGVFAELEFSHGEDIPYSIWLELRFGGRNAIIAPAIDYWAPIFWRDLQRIANLGLATRG